MPRHFPPAMPDQVLCKEHLRRKMEKSQAKWMRQRNQALTEGSEQEATVAVTSARPELEESSSGPREAAGPADLSAPLSSETKPQEFIHMACQMGFAPSGAQAALQEAKGDPIVAMELLIGSLSTAESPQMDSAADGSAPGPLSIQSSDGRPGSGDKFLQPATLPGIASRIASPGQTAPGVAVERQEDSHGDALFVDAVFIDEPLSPGHDVELEEMNDFLAALEIQHADLEHL